MGATEALKQKGPQKEGSLQPSDQEDKLKNKSFVQFARAQSGPGQSGGANSGLFFGSGPSIPHSLFCPIHKMLEPAIMVQAELIQN